MAAFSVHRDHLLAALLLGLAGLVYHEAGSIRTLGADIGVVDATFFPKLVAALIGACALLIAVQARKAPQARIAFALSRDTVQVLGFVVLMGVTMWSIPVLGFEVASVIFLCVAMLALGMRRIPLMLVIAFGLTGIVYTVFVKIMFVPLPSVFTL